MLHNDAEGFKPIPEFPGYFLHPDGRCWTERYRKRRFLKPRHGSTSRTNWPMYALQPETGEAVRSERRIVDLLASTFLGPCPAGMALFAPKGSMALVDIEFRLIHPANFTDFKGEWRRISLAPLYWASERGDIWSEKSLQIRKPAFNPVNGYFQLPLLRPDGRKVSGAVHTFIADAFLGPRPEKAVIDHIDGSKVNNAASNLRYCTNSENIAAAYTTGQRGSKAAPAQIRIVLTSLQKALTAQGLTNAEIADVVMKARSGI